MKTFAIFLCGTWILVIIAGCASESSGRSTPRATLATSTATTGCFADSIVKLDWDGAIPDCKSQLTKCKASCASGNASYCLGAAYATEAIRDSEVDAQLLFQHACLLGVAIACTNYAAHVWSNDYTTVQLACALKAVEKSCAAGEHFGCGMKARLVLEEGDTVAPEKVEQERAELEESCLRLGGFPCRVLALHLEKGEFGKYEPSRIKVLLEKACKGGDSGACGTHASARETLKKN